MGYEDAERYRWCLGGGYTDDWCTHIVLYNSYSIRDYLILVADDLCYVSDVKLQYLIWLLDPPHPRCSDKNSVGVPTFAGMIAQLCGTLQPATVKDSIQTLQTNQVNCLLSSTAISCLSLFIKLCVYASGKSYSICRNVCVRARVCAFFPLCECVCVCFMGLAAGNKILIDWLIDWLPISWLSLLKVISAIPSYSQYLKIVYLILASPWIVVFSSLYGKLFWLPSKMFPWVHVNLLPSKLVHPCT